MVNEEIYTCNGTEACEILPRGTNTNITGLVYMPSMGIENFCDTMV